MTHERIIQVTNKYKWSKAPHCIVLIFHHIGLKMEEVIVVVYYDGDVVSISEGVLFECPNGSKFIKISEEMSFVALRKAVMDIVRGGRSLFEFFIANLYM